MGKVGGGGGGEVFLLLEFFRYIFVEIYIGYLVYFGLFGCLLGFV